jgi:hypothetical protein
MTSASFNRLQGALTDIRDGLYRTVTYTADGTVIIADARTGVSASGSNLSQAKSNFARAEVESSKRPIAAASRFAALDELAATTRTAETNKGNGNV